MIERTPKKLGAVMALGEWKSQRMMRRYAAVTDETLRGAVEAVNGNSQWQSQLKSRRH